MVTDNSIKKKRHTALIIFSVIILSILILLISIFAIGRYMTEKETEEVKRFIGQIITSVNEGTDFYKKQSHEKAVENIQDHKGEISVDYEIFINEVSMGHYECSVTFNNKTKFGIVVEAYKDDIRLTHFFPIKE